MVWVYLVPELLEKIMPRAAGQPGKAPATPTAQTARPVNHPNRRAANLPKAPVAGQL
jgi:hypothetical protein